MHRAGAAKAPKRANIGEHFALHGIVTCGGCNVPLRSSFARSKLGKRYPYYLCQTKTCENYGNSIKRDQLEGEIGTLIEKRDAQVVPHGSFEEKLEPLPRSSLSH